MYRAGFLALFTALGCTGPVAQPVDADDDKGAQVACWGVAALCHSSGDATRAGEADLVLGKVVNHGHCDGQTWVPKSEAECLELGGRLEPFDGYNTNVSHIQIARRHSQHVVDPPPPNECGEVTDPDETDLYCTEHLNPAIYKLPVEGEGDTCGDGWFGAEHPDCNEDLVCVWGILSNRCHVYCDRSSPCSGENRSCVIAEGEETGYCPL